MNSPFVLCRTPWFANETTCPSAETQQLTRLAWSYLYAYNRGPLWQIYIFKCYYIYIGGVSSSFATSSLFFGLLDPQDNLIDGSRQIDNLVRREIKGVGEDGDGSRGKEKVRRCG